MLIMVMASRLSAHPNVEVGFATGGGYGVSVDGAAWYASPGAPVLCVAGERHQAGQNFGAIAPGGNNKSNPSTLCYRQPRKAQRALCREQTGSGGGAAR